ncbi:hypothetical protein J6590_101367 [Homalodisca vitripennis]|nr:hypothetical protein J6590_101367 [Homalodisca vitripennis]
MQKIRSVRLQSLKKQTEGSLLADSGLVLIKLYSFLITDRVSNSLSLRTLKQMFVHPEPLLQRRMLRISCGRFAAHPTLRRNKAYCRNQTEDSLLNLLQSPLHDLLKMNFKSEAFQAYGSAYGRSQMFPLLRPITCDASEHSVGALMKQKLRRLAVVVGPSSPRSLIQSNDSN